VTRDVLAAMNNNIIPTCYLYGHVSSLMMQTAGSHYVLNYMTYQKANIILRLKVFRCFFERIAETNSTDGHCRNQTDVAVVSLSVNETIDEGNVTSVLILLWCKVKKTWP